jgi:2-methylisocitrate lyase-like PEP mutase family enzyme
MSVMSATPNSTPSSTSNTTSGDTFRELHRDGTFVMPNPFDIGSARLLAALGFSALATTSAGFAATLGRPDMAVTRDELLDHVAALSCATSLPLNVDAERCFSEKVEGVAETIALLGHAGAAGSSIEDWDPVAARIDDVATAVARVSAAAVSARANGVVLTARCENHIRGVQDLDDTLTRLSAYRDAGADVLYAPGLVDAAHIARVVALGLPVNVLLLSGGPTVAELAALGVRRISLGSALARAAHGAVVAMAQAVLETGTLDPQLPMLSGSLVADAFIASPE